MELHNTDDWRQSTTEDIDRAVNGSISSGLLIKTAANKKSLDRWLYALDRPCQSNEANPLIKDNLHRRLDGQPPLKSLEGLEVQIINIFIPYSDLGYLANELYIIEAGKVIRLAERNIDNDLFSNRLKEYYLNLYKDTADEF